jgi:hypothetical protein
MDAEQIDFGVLAVPVVLVVVTSLVFDLAITVVGIWIFVELVTVWLLYGGLALVTRPETAVRERGALFLPGPVDWIDERFDADRQLSLPGVPPVYPKNLRFAVPTALLTAIGVLGVGSGLATDGGIGWRSGGSTSELIAAFAVFDRPVVAAVGAIIVVAQIARFYRCHVATGRYERLTEYMVLDMQATYMLIYIFGLFPSAIYLLVTLVTSEFVFSPVLGESTAQAVWPVVAAGGLGAAKLLLERYRTRGERRSGLDGDDSTTRLTPTPPPGSGSTRTDELTRQSGRSNGN